MTISKPEAAQKTVDRVLNVLGNRSGSLPKESSAPAVAKSATHHQEFDFTALPEYEILKIKRAVGDIVGLENPFYRLHDGRAGATTSIAGRVVVNFSSYDYLGINGHPAVVAAALEAINTYGTSVSASRISAGERQVHRDLETALAQLHGVADAVSFVGGHATNVSVIGDLLGAEDLLVTDVAIHNSITEGAKLSGAKRILCQHGDLDAMERALRLNRARCRRALIVVEGLYSMDGDVPDLAQLIKLKRRYNSWLMVDEAHSCGVLGASGRGIAEEQNIDPTEVDIWMGTLSKSFVAVGGYIAGSRPLIELLRYTSPGFVFSVGQSPPLAAAALAAIKVMQAEPWRLEELRQNGRAFAAGARRRGFDIGPTIGASVVPIIVGNSPHAVMLSQRLLARGYNVVPAIFPGVPENQARLRFFITSEHTLEQIEGALDAVAEELTALRNAPSLVSMVTQA